MVSKVTSDSPTIGIDRDGDVDSHRSRIFGDVGGNDGDLCPLNRQQRQDISRPGFSFSPVGTRDHRMSGGFISGIAGRMSQQIEPHKLDGGEEE
jgi:hypothetical protein